VEWVGEDLGEPHQPGLNAAQEEQVDGAEQERPGRQRDPEPRQVREEALQVGVGCEQPAERRCEHQQQRRQPPDRVQDDLAPKVVADLHLLLVGVGGLILLVVALGLEYEVADLPDAHGEDPAKQRGSHRLREQQHVRHQEAERAHQVQRLVDTAVVIEAVIVPALFLELREETLALHWRLLLSQTVTPHRNEALFTPKRSGVM